jgi:hypothetical protein
MATIKVIPSIKDGWFTDYSVTIKWADDEVLTGPITEPANGWLQGLKTLKDGTRKMTLMGTKYQKDVTESVWLTRIKSLSGCDAVIVAK